MEMESELRKAEVQSSKKRNKVLRRSPDWLRPSDIIGDARLEIGRGSLGYHLSSTNISGGLCLCADCKSLSRYTSFQMRSQDARVRLGTGLLLLVDGLHGTHTSGVARSTRWNRSVRCCYGLDFLLGRCCPVSYVLSGIPFIFAFPLNHRFCVFVLCSLVGWLEC
jgi:hypothetical protein